jgi:twitching motility two-component system response regulator PilG
MEPNNTFRISPFGLSERELRVLNTICLVSRSRARTYEVSNTEAPRAADFAIVNGDDPQAVATWQLFHASNPLSGAVMLANQPVSDWQGHQIGRPIMSTRLLAILDHLEVGSARRAPIRRAASGESTQLQEHDTP